MSFLLFKYHEGGYIVILLLFINDRPNGFRKVYSTGTEFCYPPCLLASFVWIFNSVCRILEYLSKLK